MLWLRAGRKHEEQDISGISLDREDNERREQFSKSVRRVRVSRSLLGLAWTAGPVTGLGLYGGYYIGFGHAPSTQLLIYFVSFTILSGLIALIAKIVYDSTWGFAREQAERNITEAIDKLGDLILAVRDLVVDNFDGETRRREAALQLLQRVDLSPDGVAFACEELTGDRELGQLLAKIDTFRRAGLYSRIRDVQAEHEAHFEQVIADMHQVAPVAANMLRQRYEGNVAHLQCGMPRTEYFVERVLAAIEQDNLLLITMQDVESMLVLAFELINGREIPMLIFAYRGRWRLAAALDNMERRRSRYRIAQAAGSNRIRALASWLVEIDALSYEEVPEGLSSTILIERVRTALNMLSRRVDDMTERYRAGETDLRGPLRREAEILTTALRLYRIAHESFQRIGRVHADFLAAANTWNNLLEKMHSGPEHLSVGPGGRGLRIIEKTVDLGEEERKEVCRHLVRYMRAHDLEGHEGSENFRRFTGKDKPLTLDSARQLAVEVALALEPHVKLSYPEIQRGINATQATYLGDLESGMSAHEKRQLGEAMVNDIEEDMSRAAEHLALALVRHYRINLTDAACDFLHRTYGARRSVLDILSQHQIPDTSSQSLLVARPAVVLPARRSWYRCLVRAKRQVGDDKFNPPWGEKA